MRLCHFTLGKLIQACQQRSSLPSPHLHDHATPQPALGGIKPSAFHLRLACVIMPCHRRRRMSASARPAVHPAQEPAHTAAPRTAASAAAAHASVSSARCASQHEKVTGPSLAWEKPSDATAHQPTDGAQFAYQGQTVAGDKTRSKAGQDWQGLGPERTRAATSRTEAPARPKAGLLTAARCHGTVSCCADSEQCFDW